MLAASNLDGAQQRRFGGRNIGRLHLQKKFTAHPMHLSHEPALLGLLDLEQLRIQGRKPGLHGARVCLHLRYQGTVKREPQSNVQLTCQRQPLAHLCACLTIAAATARPAMKESAMHQPCGHFVLARQREKSARMFSGSVGFTADCRENTRVAMRACYGRYGVASQGQAECFLSKASRPIDFSQRPEHQTEEEHGNNAGIVAKAGGKMAIALVVICCNSLFEVYARANVIAVEPASYAKDTMRHADLWRFGQALRFSYKDICHLAHAREVCSQKASGP